MCVGVEGECGCVWRVSGGVFVEGEWRCVCVWRVSGGVCEGMSGGGCVHV